MVTKFCQLLPRPYLASFSTSKRISVVWLVSFAVPAHSVQLVWFGEGDSEWF